MFINFFSNKHFKNASLPNRTRRKHSRIAASSTVTAYDGLSEKTIRARATRPHTQQHSSLWVSAARVRLAERRQRQFRHQSADGRQLLHPRGDDTVPQQAVARQPYRQGGLREFRRVRLAQLSSSGRHRDRH